MTTSYRPGGSPWLAAAQAVDPRRLLPASARPPADSVGFYAVLAVVGIAELVEWPAVLLAAAAQALVDRRLNELEHRRSSSALDVGGVITPAERPRQHRDRPGR